MAYLEENEWMLLNETAYNISFIYSFDDMRKEVLLWLKKLIPFDVAVFSKVDDNGNIKDSIGFNLEQKYLDIFDKNYLDESPISWVLNSKIATATRKSDMLSEKKMVSDSFYKKFYAPNLLYYSISMNIAFQNDVVGLISFYKKKENHDFEDKDMFILDQLHKHFAYRLYYEAKKGDTRFFYAKGYHERITNEFGLTARESELLNYAVKGLDNEEIAKKMNVTVNTVKKHFHSLYTKMNVKNRVQLIQSLPLSTDKINFDEI